MALRSIALMSGLILAPLAALAAPDGATPGRAPRQVTLQLKWKHQFQFAGYYVASERGLYRAAGLDVAIREGSDDSSVAAVASGDADFGVAMSDLVLYRSQGVPVVALASVFQHSPLVLLVRGDLGLDNLHALDGRDVMIEPHAAELIAYLEVEKMPLSRLTVHPHTFSTRSMIDGDVDAMSAYLTDEPFELLEAGVPYNLFIPRSGGIDFYGDTLYTSERMIEQHPEIVAAFRSASMEGWRWALEHPEETADLILKKISDRHSRKHLLFEAEQTRKLVLDNVVEIGYINPGRWRHIADVYASLGMLPPDLNLDGFVYDPNPAPDLTRFYATAGIFLVVGFFITAVAVRYYRLSGRLQDEIVVRQRVEADLDHRENELRVLMSNLPGMAYRCRNQRDWPMEFVSQGCGSLTGYDAPELVDNARTSYAEIIHPDDREQVWRDVQAAVAENRAFRLTYRIITASGDERWVWEQGCKIETPVGEPRIEGFITDITELKQAEHERELLISQLRSALDEIDALRGIIPICSGCKRIRDDQGYWNQIEGYISERSGADFSHGICPECRDRLYGDMGRD